MNTFDYFTEQLSTRWLAELCGYVLQNPRFHEGLGSAEGSHKHHAYKGGLAVHTLEVLNYAFAAASQLPKTNLDVVIVAAIYHDVMKIHEYRLDGGISVKTPYRQFIRHVAGSYAEFINRANNYTEDEIPEALKQQIGHCILAHHGRLEAGSPVEPQTVEALIVHQADLLSSVYGPGRCAHV